MRFCGWAAKRPKRYAVLRDCIGRRSAQLVRRMKAFAIIALFLGAAFCSGEKAPDQTSNPKSNFVAVGLGALTGEDFLKLTKSEREFYCLGFFEALLASSIFGADEAQIKQLSDKKAGVTATQLTAIAEKHLRQHPERWNQAANAQIAFAFEQAFLRK